jgi:hypothetical protein
VVISMKLRKLNFGGIFGGVVCAAAAVAIIYLLSDHAFRPRSLKAVALAGFLGAAAGNWIWRLAEPRLPEEQMWGQSLIRDQRQEKG